MSDQGHDQAIAYNLFKAALCSWRQAGTPITLPKWRGLHTKHPTPYSIPAGSHPGHDSIIVLMIMIAPAHIFNSSTAGRAPLAPQNFS